MHVRLGIVQLPRLHSMIGRPLVMAAAALLGVASMQATATADSVNSPNVTMNVDTNRSTGAGAGNVAIAINTVTIAETMLPEYSSGAGQAIKIQAKPGFQFDPTSSITAQSATIGINGGGINVVATVVPSGAADEVITFSLTSGTDVNVQDIIRVNGIKVLIRDARGAVGPAQTTLSLTTSAAGGAFTDQGIVAASITKGVPDHLTFASQPGSTQTGLPLLPSVSLVDFGGNIITNDQRTITLALQDNPGSATLNGDNSVITQNGVATWLDAENLNIVTAATGYTLRASHSGAALQSSDTADSTPFDILAGAPNHLRITTEPVNTTAGGDILIEVTVFDENENVVTTPPVNITLEAAINPGGWPLLVAGSLTKETVDGVATWADADDLRITKAVTGYRLAASGIGDPVFSTQFDVAPGAPAALRFVQQPTDTDVNASMDPAPTVEVIDGFGNRTDSAVAIELAIDAATCGGALNGGAANSNAGIATFATVTIDTACSDALMTASSAGLVGAVSESFDVDALPNANDNENAGDDGNANDNGDDAPDDGAVPPPCGLCGAGSTLAFMPLLLAMTAMRMLRRGR